MSASGSVRSKAPNIEAAIAVKTAQMPKITQWLLKLKRDGKSKDTLWTYGERVRNFVQYLTPRYISKLASMVSRSRINLHKVGAIGFAAPRSPN